MTYITYVYIHIIHKLYTFCINDFVIVDFSMLTTAY